MFIDSFSHLACFRSSENDNKLERNIEFIAEVLARHIFNLTTKVSSSPSVLGCKSSVYYIYIN